MYNLLLKIFFLFNSYIIINSDEINVNKKSILTFNYQNFKKVPSSISLNNAYYRESSLLPNNKGLFSIGVNPGSYFINSNDINYNITIEKGKLIKSNSKMKTKLLKTKKNIILEKINYNYHKDHEIKISSMINLIKFYNKPGKYKIELIIDNNIIFSTINYNNVFTFFSKPIKMKKGVHIILLKGISLANIWCSCLEANNGFSFGRHLTAWIIDNDENENKNKYTKKSIPNKNTIKHNIIKNIIYTYKKNIKNNNYINLIKHKINFDYKKLLFVQY